MTSHSLDLLLSRFSDLSILVVGDFFLDRYLDIDPTLSETSLETGLEANQVVRVRNHPGCIRRTHCRFRVYVSTRYDWSRKHAFGSNSWGIRTRNK